MSLTVTEAKDEMFAVVRTAWGGSSTSRDIPMLYPSIAKDPPKSGAWARPSIQHAGGGQATLANHDGVSRWERVGTVTVQIFTPKNDGDELSDLLVQILLDAFDGTRTAGGVVFKNTRPNEAGQDGEWDQTNVVTDFEYDEVK